MPRFSLHDAPFARGTGRGVHVAVVDSGVAPGHPHVGAVAGGTHILTVGSDDDWRDRIGHGTAVAGVIREKAPEAALWGVRVFDEALSTTADVLDRAMRWAAAQCAIINVSVGTTNHAHRDALAAAVDAAVANGAWVVAAAMRDAEPMLPGVLPGVLGVLADPALDRDEIVLEPHGDALRFRAAPYPRPIPGVPVSANLQGVSFAVANVTGFLARVVQAAAPPDTTVLWRLASDPRQPS